MGLNDIYEKTMQFFLKPIAPLMKSNAVSEVMIVGTEAIYYEKGGELHTFSERFDNEELLMAAVRNLAEFVGRQIDEFHHSMDGRLPSGHRVHAIIPPASQSGICVTIRKFQTDFFGLEHLVEKGSLTAEAAEFLTLAVLLHKNTVVAGGTGTGKTTMLNALSTRIPEKERIVVIEDSKELQLQQKHTLYLEAQQAKDTGEPAITIRDLFVDSLRMRPDRIVVGEVRRGEALDLIQSMISGHAGALTTVHATTPRDAACRLETLSMQSDTNMPVYVARAQVASAIHLVVQLARMPDHSRRITEISECLGLGPDQQYEWNSLFQFEGHGVDENGKLLGQLVPTGNRPTFAGEPRKLGYSRQVDHCQALFD